MKKLILENISYRSLVASFKEWLDILGYAETTVYNLPNHLQEFFYWLEHHGHTSINNITAQDIGSYYRDLTQRSNERRYGALSKSYLNKHQQALKKFREYLQHHGHQGISIHLKLETNPTEEKINILSQSEIKQLFTATHYSHLEDRFKLRDRTILVLLYSCGLRRTEAVSLDVKDVFFEKERIHVRRGKNYKERFIPINRYNLSILEEYIYESRPDFNIKGNTEALLLNYRGSRLLGTSLSNRLKAIIAAADNPNITEKQITLHTLRHSIATHLLQKEVALDTIKSFLGHSSLESTQIYTHLIKTITYE